MRQFLYVGHEAPTTPDFALDNLTGAGRLDLLARSITAALLLSHDIRRDTRAHLVLDDEFTIRFDGGSAQGLNPDERSTAARIRSTLDEREEAIGHIPVEVTPGIELFRRGFEATLTDIASEGTVIQLHESGTGAGDVTPPDDPIFVLSDHQEFTDAEQRLLDDTAEQRVSLGPQPLHADHATVVVHNWCDTNGFRHCS